MFGSIKLAKEIKAWQRSMEQEKKPMTNADRIRTMSDEELATFLDNVSIRCPRPSITEDCSMPGGCKMCALKWLQQPAEEQK